jgi:hypothetical protein
MGLRDLHTHTHTLEGGGISLSYKVGEEMCGCHRDVCQRVKSVKIVNLRINSIN